jgi:hypothetical protein
MADDRNQEFRNNTVRITTTIVCGLIFSGVVLGCSKKSDTNSLLENAAKELQATEAIPPAPPSPPPQSVQSVQPAPTTSQPALAPVQEMNQAMASYKSGNLEDAVTRLYKLRAQTAMTPQQLIAVQEATAAVMGEVYALAAKGDARAIAAVKQYEQMQNRR